MIYLESIAFTAALYFTFAATSNLFYYISKEIKEVNPVEFVAPSIFWGLFYLLINT